jgi:uncharacterized membrane protein YidH (DUF202 family)
VSRPGRFLWDPGAQPERTYQAWSRTTLSLAGCGLLLTRLTPAVGPVALVLAGCVVLAALAVAAAARRRLRAGRLGAAPHPVAALAALVVAAAAAALALLVVRG